MSFKLCVFHVVVSLLYGIPSVLDAHFLYSIASKFLDVETVDYMLGFRKATADNPAHGVRQVECHLLDRFALLLRYYLQCLDDILGLRA